MGSWEAFGVQASIVGSFVSGARLRDNEGAPRDVWA
jgi:hypothetical protein